MSGRHPGLLWSHSLAPGDTTLSFSSSVLGVGQSKNFHSDVRAMLFCSHCLAEIFFGVANASLSWRRSRSGSACRSLGSCDVLLASSALRPAVTCVVTFSMSRLFAAKAPVTETASATSSELENSIHPPLGRLKTATIGSRNSDARSPKSGVKKTCERGLRRTVQQTRVRLCVTVRRM